MAMPKRVIKENKMQLYPTCHNLMGPASACKYGKAIARDNNRCRYRHDHIDWCQSGAAMKDRLIRRLYALLGAKQKGWV